MAMGKRKVLFIVEAMGGGVFTYIVNLTNRLVDTFDMYLAYATRPQTPKDYRTYFDSRIHLIQVQNFTREINLRRDVKAFAELVAIKKHVQPDIIHLHSSKAGVLGRLAFACSNTPLFYTPHGYSFLMEDAGHLKRWLYRMIEVVLAKAPCTTISCSEGEQLETLKLTKHAVYVDNGIELRELDRYLAPLSTLKPLPTHTYTVFTLGRICYQKNPELFNQIARRLPNVRFFWIGDGELREELDSSNITVTGWADRETAIECAQMADCFLLTSRWEGLPISLLESMYMRKPCVVSNIIGNHDVIRNGQNGFLCTTVDEFVEAIHQTKNPAVSAQICSAAYQDILNKYNVEVMAGQYAAIYEAALKSTAVPGPARQLV